ncbi:MAG: filamentous hemagglutinin N-terminal domain-containing protein [Negativicutes bacterium]|nr:filamentous hemagglutinin N-terminal domain-containing protein [Negativicutes bacterium]MDR3590726.1 filamentous hemagglutinin N-terminal domain-containing protein [Negativicutes bacterium]
MLLKNNRSLAKLTILAFVLTMALQPVTASAQVVADANAGKNKPVVTTVNGAPVVDITAPSAAGVSRNLYLKFDVGAEGVTLQNSTALARIILNEVTGPGASYFNGPLTVAGQRADVILANPNGIVVGGGSFINVGRAVLTTGTALLDRCGSLDSFQTTGGQITIDTNGLNASGADRLDLISRVMVINGQIHAKQLNAIAGANSVSYATLDTKHIDRTGQAPQVAISVGALGGMYADKIKLISTERGVGVNSLGTIAASGGDLTLSGKGTITLKGKTAASGNVTIQGSALDLSGGNLYSGANTSLKASAGELNNTGGRVNASGDLTIFAGAVNNTVGVLNSSGNLTITTGAANEHPHFHGDFRDFCSRQAASISQYGLNNTSGVLNASGNIVITTGAITNTQNLTGNAASNSQYAINNTSGRINTSGNITVTTGAITNIQYLSGDDWARAASTIAATNSQYAFNNTSGFINTSGNVTISTGAITNIQYQTGDSWSRNVPTVTTSSSQYAVDNTNGHINTSGNVTITTGALTNTQYAFGKTATVIANSQYAFNDKNGFINTSGNVAISTGKINFNLYDFGACGYHSTLPTISSDIQYAINRAGDYINTSGSLTITTGTVQTSQK